VSAGILLARHPACVSAEAGALTSFVTDWPWQRVCDVGLTERGVCLIAMSYTLEATS
jgi:hypothetical protein